MLVNACEVQKQAVGCLVVKLAKKATSVLSGIRKDKFGSNKEDEMKKKELYLAESSSRRCGRRTTLSHISLRMRWALAFLSLDSTTDGSEDGPVRRERA